MPQGVKGFQPGRPKTGGRPTKEAAAATAAEKVVRKPAKFVDQLSFSGFDYVKELASVLKDIRDLRKSTPDPVRAAELKFFYSELKSLLPFMAPKLREKEVDTTEPTEAMPTEASFSTEDLLKAFNGKETTDHPRASDPPPVEPGSIELQVPASTAEDSPSMDREQEED